MSEHVNRDLVMHRIERLRAEYGPLYGERETVDVEPARFSEEIELSRDGYHGSAYGWIVRAPEDAPGLTESMPADARTQATRVLMILGRAGQEWGIPGGGIEDDERLEATVSREVKEETDIDCVITDCFGIRHEMRTAQGYGVTLHNIRAIFDATYEGGSIALQPGELAGAAWWKQSPRRLHPLVEARASRWFAKA
jgi:8-oxo-dGTP diphosphatase